MRDNDGEIPAPGRRATGVRSRLIGEAVASSAQWTLRLLVLAVGLAGLWWLLARLWVVVLPVLLGVILAALLWPPTGWLRRRRWPAALASATVLLLALGMLGVAFMLIVPQLANELSNVVDAALSGVDQVRQWLVGPPFQLADGQIDRAFQQALDQLRQSATSVASGLLVGLTAVGSAVVTGLLTLVLTFLFLKDGDRFLPWVRRVGGGKAGGHIAEALGRVWHTTQGFLLTQVAIALLDAVFIGAGLLIVGVPLAVPLAVLTFLGGLVPIAGAVVAGALAVLVALVSNGLTAALIVLAIVVGVQQIEGNVLQPILQGRTLRLHAAVVVLAVTAGAALYGVAGAFLAVPFVAALAALLRYADEVFADRTDRVLVARADAHQHRRTAGRRGQGHKDQDE